MAWALTIVVAIGVGLPTAAWLITRRLPSARPASRLGVGYDAIDKWLLDQYQLPPHDRWRVRKAVFQGSQVNEATLGRATNDLANRVLTGGFRRLRLSQGLGWVELIASVGFAGTGIFLLITMDGLVLGILGLVNSGLFMFAGMMRARWFPKQIRRNVTKALQLNQDFK